MDSLMTRDKLKGSDKEPGHAPRKTREGGGRRPASLKTGMKEGSPSSGEWLLCLRVYLVHSSPRNTMFSANRGPAEAYCKTVH